MTVKLPNGLIDGADLFDYVTVDEIRGKQQNYLANREFVIGNIGHVPKLLEDLIKSIETKEGLQWKGQIKDAVWQLPVGDLEAILIKIREKTYGPRFYFEAECNSCGHLNKDQRLDLDKLKLDKLKSKDLFDENRLKITLPKEGAGVVLKPLYLQDLFSSIKVVKDDSDKLITSVLALSTKSLNGKEKILAKDLENVPASDLMYMQKQMEKLKLEGSIDTDVQIVCAKCKVEFESKLDVFNSDFFDPSKGSTNTDT